MFHVDGNYSDLEFGRALADSSGNVKGPALKNTTEFKKLKHMEI